MIQKIPAKSYAIMLGDGDIIISYIYMVIYTELKSWIRNANF